MGEKKGGKEDATRNTGRKCIGKILRGLK